MKNNIFTAVLCLLVMIGLSQGFLHSQCSSGETAYTLTLTSGSFDSESHWIISPAPASGLDGQPCGQYAPGTYDLCLTNGTNYTFTAFDDWGDGWNGGTVAISDALGCVILAAIVPSNGTSGDATTDCAVSDTEYTFSWDGGGLIEGCTDPTALNYNNCAAIENGSCLLPPSNDECANAVTLVQTLGVSLQTYSAANGTESLAPAACDGFTASSPVKDVWFCFTAVGNSATILVSDPNDPTLCTFDAVVELFDGCGGASLACDDVPCPETINIASLTDGNEYCFRVFPYSTFATALDFGVSVYGAAVGCTAPASCDDNDPCTLDECTAGVCSNTFQDADGDLTCDANDGCPTDPNKTAPGNCGCGNPEPGAACDDGNAATNADIIQANCTCAGSLPPSNTLCDNAVLLCDALPLAVTGNTVASATSPVTSCASSFGSLNGVWYVFTNNVAANLTFSTCGGANFDTQISIYTGDCAAASCVGGNDDFCSLQSEVSIAATANTTYYIFVHNYSSTDSAGGPFTLNIISDNIASEATCITSPNSLTLTDPCSCGNPANILNPTGAISLFAEEITINGDPSTTYTLTAQSNMLNASGIPIPVGSAFTTNAAGTAVLAFYHAGAPAGFSATFGTTTISGGTTCSATVCAGGIPTASEWGLMCLALMMMSMLVIYVRERPYSMV